MTTDKVTITKNQIKKIYTLLNLLGLSNRKDDHVKHFTNGRTTHCSEMTAKEAVVYIIALEYELEIYGNARAMASATDNRQYPKAKAKSNISREYMLNEIYNLAFEWGIIYGETDDDKAINLFLIDRFCLTRGTVKKRLEQMAYIELKKTFRQFQTITRQYRDKQPGKR